MKKRIALLLAAAFMIFPAAGCGQQDITDNTHNPPQNIARANETAGPDSTQNAGMPSIVPETVNPEDAGDAVTLDGSVTTIALGETIGISGGGAAANGGTVSITAAGNYSVSGTLADGRIVINSDGATINLELAGADITNPAGPAVYVADAKQVNILLKEGTVNSLTDGSSYSDVKLKAALFSEDPLTIRGNGTLNVTGKYKHGIASDDTLTVEGGNINVKSAVTDGLHANDDVTIDGGILSITAESDGIESELTANINAGTLKIDAGDDGVHADTELVINGGNICITRSYEGLEGKTKVTINSGGIRLKCDDDSINAGEDLVINGGYIYADCEGDGLDSNGNMTVNGGTTVIFSGNNANGPIDVGDRNGTCTINGGTVIAAGGNMGISVSEGSKQHSMWIASRAAANTLVNISGQGGELATFSMLKEASLIFYTSDKLTANASYEIKTGGSHSGEAVDGVYNGGSYSGGSSLGSVAMSAKSVSLGNAGGMGGWKDFGRGEGGRRPQ